MGDQYCLIGPYKESSARTEIEEVEFPHNSPLHLAVQVLRDQGFKVSSCNTGMDVINSIDIFTIKTKQQSKAHHEARMVY